MDAIIRESVEGARVRLGLADTAARRMDRLAALLLDICDEFEVHKPEDCVRGPRVGKRRCADEESKDAKEQNDAQHEEPVASASADEVSGSDGECSSDSEDTKEAEGADRKAAAAPAKTSTLSGAEWRCAFMQALSDVPRPLLQAFKHTLSEHGVELCLPLVVRVKDGSGSTQTYRGVFSERSTPDDILKHAGLSKETHALFHTDSSQFLSQATESLGDVIERLAAGAFGGRCVKDDQLECFNVSVSNMVGNKLQEKGQSFAELKTRLAIKKAAPASKGSGDSAAFSFATLGGAKDVKEDEPKRAAPAVPKTVSEHAGSEREESDAEQDAAAEERCGCAGEPDTRPLSVSVKLISPGGGGDSSHVVEADRHGNVAHLKARLEQMCGARAACFAVLHSGVVQEDGARLCALLPSADAAQLALCVVARRLARVTIQANQLLPQREQSKFGAHGSRDGNVVLEDVPESVTVASLIEMVKERLSSDLAPGDEVTAQQFTQMGCKVVPLTSTINMVRCTRMADLKAQQEQQEKFMRQQLRQHEMQVKRAGDDTTVDRMQRIFEKKSRKMKAARDTGSDTIQIMLCVNRKQSASGFSFGGKKQSIFSSQTPSFTFSSQPTGATSFSFGCKSSNAPKMAKKKAAPAF